MEYRIEVYNRPSGSGKPGGGILKDIADLGIKGIEAVDSVTVYRLFGDPNEAQLKRIAEELLADPIVQDFALGSASIPGFKPDWIIEAGFKDGVTDAVGETTVKGIRDLGIDSVQSARIARKFLLQGVADRQTMELICRRLFANPVIENYSIIRS